MFTLLNSMLKPTKMKEWPMNKGQRTNLHIINLGHLDQLAGVRSCSQLVLAKTVWWKAPNCLKAGSKNERLCKSGIVGRSDRDVCTRLRIAGVQCNVRDVWGEMGTMCQNVSECEGGKWRGGKERWSRVKLGLDSEKERGLEQWLFVGEVGL